MGNRVLLIAFGTLITTCSAQGLFIPSPASRWILEYLVPSSCRFSTSAWAFSPAIPYDFAHLAPGPEPPPRAGAHGHPFVAFTVLVLLRELDRRRAKPPCRVPTSFARCSSIPLFRRLLLHLSHYLRHHPHGEKPPATPAALPRRPRGESGHRGARFTARHHRSRRAPPLRRHLRGRELDLGCRRHGHGALPGPSPSCAVPRKPGPSVPCGWPPA